MVVLLAALLLFTLATFIVHRNKSKSELELLKEKGYYNPVSVGDYSLNVAKFGNEQGSHTIVSLAGLGMGDYSVTERQMTESLEKDNLVVFVDRAGYGLSDDTDSEMTLEYIVEDYRKALKSADIQAPYILAAHSVGGAYANYWSSKYPKEIEAVVFLDGSQLDENAFEEEPEFSPNFGDKAYAFLAKLGFNRYVLRDYSYLYPDNFSEEEQRLSDTLSLMTLDSIALISETGMLTENAQNAFNQIVTNDIPKLYICASWGFQTAEELNENGKWVNRQIEKNGLDMPKWPTNYKEDDEKAKKILDNCKKGRQETIHPYAEKMGNCTVACVPGDHLIYVQKPDECSKLIQDFIVDLEK
uniref:alpha/beta hydrolase n=1 Tax=Acetivibrio cellulolyticus TaxID=35830 RepID=UPI001F3EBFBA|nr:alpha/beta hydrolase [Acetivibrio cellulolyticus]